MKEAYIQNEDCLIPKMKLSEPESRPIGKYGRMRADYLKEYRPALWKELMLSEKLYRHLREIDETAYARLEIMLPRLMKSAGVTEELKRNDPLKWAGLMNTLKAQAEEVIFHELIHC